MFAHHPCRDRRRDLHQVAIPRARYRVSEQTGREEGKTISQWLGIGIWSVHD
jgi:hypothetical protein